MYEVKQETVRIILKAQRRDAFLHLILDSIELLTMERAAVYYWIVLKNSCKIFNMIAKMRRDHTLVQRPFIYN